MSIEHLDKNNPKDILEDAAEHEWDVIVVIGLGKDQIVHSAWNTSSPLTRIGLLQCAISDCLAQMQDEGEKGHQFH